MVCKFYLISICWLPLICTGQIVGKSNILLGDTSAQGILTNMEKDSLRPKSQGVKPKEKIEFSFSNTYIQDSDSTFLGEGLFADYHVSRKMNVHKVPLSLEGHLVLQNNKINRRFSGVRVAFDSESFLQEYKQQIIEKKQLANPKNLQKHVKEDWTKLISDKTGKQIIHDHLDSIAASTILAYQTELDSAKSQYKRDSTIEDLECGVDSLMAIKDSAFQRIVHLERQISMGQDWYKREHGAVDAIKSRKEALGYAVQLPEKLKNAPGMKDSSISLDLPNDSTYKKGIDLLNRYQDYEKNSLTNIKKRFSDQAQVLKEEQASLEEMANPETILQQAKAVGISMAPWQKFMLGIEKLEIGGIQLTDAPLLVGNVPANGFTGAWHRGKYHIETAIGKEGKSDSRQFNDFIRNTNRYGLNRQVAQMKLGRGNRAQTYYGASLTRFSSDVPPELSENPVPQRTLNVLLGIEGVQTLSKKVFIDAHCVLSNTDVTGNSTIGQLLTTGSDDILGRSAAEVAFGYRITGSESVIEAGYSHIGGGYMTLGNPFLITNRNDLKIKVKHKMLKKRLALMGEARINSSNNNSQSPQASQNLYTLDASWRLNKKGSRLWGRFQPMVFSQKIAGEEQSLQLNTYTVGFQDQRSIGKTVKWVNLLQATNFRQEANVSDTSYSIGRLFLTAQQNLLLQSWCLNLTAYGGLERSLLKEGQVACTVTKMTKKIQVNTGVQLLRRPFDPAPRKGLLLGLNMNFGHLGDLGFSATWYERLTDEGRSGLYATSTLRIIL